MRTYVEIKKTTPDLSIVKRLGGSRGAKVLTLLRFAKYIAEKNDDFVHFALDLGLSPSSTSRTNRFLFLQYRLKFQPSCCRFCANPGVQPYPLPEKLPDFCRELCQLLCRTLAITHEKFRSPTSGRFSPLQSTCQNGCVLRGKRTRGVPSGAVCLFSQISAKQKRSDSLLEA